MEKMCDHCSFSEEDVFRQEPIEELERDSDCHIFRFRQKGKCYCFCVADLYRWIYGSLDLGEDVKTDKNPKTRRSIKAPTLYRLKREYEAYYKTVSRTSDVTDREKQEFLDGIDLFKASFETSHSGLKLDVRKIIYMYMSDLEEILGREELDRQKVIASEVIKERNW
jgi:hypothetical protein